MTRIKIINPGAPKTMEPLCCGRKLLDIPVAGATVGEHLRRLFTGDGEGTMSLRGDFWPSPKTIDLINHASGNLLVFDRDKREVIRLERLAGSKFTRIEDDDAILLRYPWDILSVNERIISLLNSDSVHGTVRHNVNIDGHLILGEGSVLLPGVYIEGNVMIGNNCKIGPNCYIRGNTWIGDNCHIGQAVEIKNSLLMHKASVGHLGYVGDSIICSFTNFGAGTIIANLRHDGKNHRSRVGDELVDTGRRKFGAIIGEHVHTGIHTSIYPGRKIWPEMSTHPGAIVKEDLRPKT